MIARHCMLRWLVAGLVGAVSLSGPGCGKKASGPGGPPPELTGLAVVPATAEVIVGADLAKLSDSPVIDRAFEQLLTHEAELSERWKHFREDCKVELGKQVKRMMLALGRPPVPAGQTVAAPGTGPVLMVAVGSLPEAELKDCVTKLVGSGGGTLTGKAVLGRTLYQARDGNRIMYFAYSRADTVVLSADEAFITEALGSGPKAADNPEITAWRKLANQNAPLWAVGRTDARIRDGLVQVTEGKVSGGPIAFAAAADLADGIKLQLDVVMSQPEHAKSLESYVKTELALLTAAAQLKSLGSVVGKLSVSVEGAVVQFRVPLTVDDLNQLLSALDAENSSAQNRAPAQGAGSDTK